MEIFTSPETMAMRGAPYNVQVLLGEFMFKNNLKQDKITCLVM